MNRHVQKTIDHLSTKKRILFLTTSNRWSGEKGGEQPKSTALAHHIKSLLPHVRVDILDIPSLNIAICEGNVSTKRGNVCGVKDALLNNKKKNPTGLHRCWASINNPKDELWKVSLLLFEAEVVVFFGAVRWGQMNSVYQKLIERLTWLENRHSTLDEKNVLAHIDAGIIVVGQNWRGRNIVNIQKKVLSFFGFQTPRVLSWNWQFTKKNDESALSYKKAGPAFEEEFLTTL
jgi:multimeric flavodoxin WrbA